VVDTFDKDCWEGDDRFIKGRLRTDAVRPSRLRRSIASVCGLSTVVPEDCSMARSVRRENSRSVKLGRGVVDGVVVFVVVVSAGVAGDGVDNFGVSVDPASLAVTLSVAVEGSNCSKGGLIDDTCCCCDDDDDASNEFVE